MSECLISSMHGRNRLTKLVEQIERAAEHATKRHILPKDNYGPLPPSKCWCLDAGKGGMCVCVCACVCVCVCVCLCMIVT
jgi:hypothetical protein